MKRAALILMFFFLLTCSISAFAEEQDETARYDPAQGVKKLGVTHNIAPDRKVENVGGIYEPEGLDKYMKRLIESLDAKITALEAQSKRTEEKLDQVLAAAGKRENEIKQTNVLQSKPNSPPAPRNIFKK